MRISLGHRHAHRPVASGSLIYQPLLFVSKKQAIHMNHPFEVIKQIQAVVANTVSSPKIHCIYGKMPCYIKSHGPRPFSNLHIPLNCQIKFYILKLSRKTIASYKCRWIWMSTDGCFGTSGSFGFSLVQMGNKLFSSFKQCTNGLTYM